MEINLNARPFQPCFLGSHDPGAGDLAIAVKAHNPSNIGSIVKVIRKHPNQYIIPDEIGQFIWMVEGSHLLTYTKGNRIFRMRRGAVPDSYLKPIKGQPSNDQLVAGQPQQIEEKPKQKRTKREAALVSDAKKLDQSVTENA